MNIKVKQNLIFGIIFIALSIHFKFYEKEKERYLFKLDEYSKIIIPFIGVYIAGISLFFNFESRIQENKIQELVYKQKEDSVNIIALHQQLTNLHLMLNKNNPQ